MSTRRPSRRDETASPEIAPTDALRLRLENTRLRESLQAETERANAAEAALCDAQAELERTRNGQKMA